MENYTMSTTDWTSLPEAASVRTRANRPSTTAGLVVRVVAPFGARAQGTSVSFAAAAAVRTAAKATALLPTDVDVIDDVAGIRTWSPPV